MQQYNPEVKSDKSTNLVWMDLEMTGLNLEHDQVIEIATVITNKDLEIIAIGPTIAIQCADEYLDSMDDFVRQMHTNNGLLERVRNSQVTLAEAQRQTLEFIQQFTEVKSSPLCGNSIGTDKMFILKHFPAIAAHLHYRLIDVSTIKQLNNLWEVAPTYVKDSNHLAADDILASIMELRYYRQQIFNK